MALSPKFRNWLRTLGAPEDPVATDTSSEWSAMSLLKAIFGQTRSVPKSVLMFGADPTGAASSTAAFNAAALAWSDFVIPEGEYTIDDGWTVPAGVTVRHLGNPTVNFTEGSGAGLTITGSNVRLLGAAVYDGQLTTESYLSGHNAIDMRASAASPFENVEIDGLTIQNWGDNGVRADYTVDLVVENNVIQRVGRAGVLAISPIRARVNHNLIEDIAPGNGGSAPYLNAYGITFTRNAVDSAVTDPIALDCEAIGNVVDGVPSWEGLDTHGGRNVRFISNTVRNCLVGISAVPADSLTPTYFSAREILIAHNYIDGTNADGDGKSSGIYVSPATAAAGVTYGNRVIGNTLVNCGTDDPAYFAQGAAIYMSMTAGAQVTDNHLYNSDWSAIDLDNIVTDGVVTGNQIIGVNEFVSNKTGIRARTATVLAVSDSNSFDGSFDAHHVMIAPSAGYALRVGLNTYKDTPAFKSTYASNTFSNADFTMRAGDIEAAQIGTMSAARVVTIPLANAYPPKTRIRVCDLSGTVTNVNTVSVARSGSDTINGAGSNVVVGSVANFYTELETDGISKWVIPVADSVSGGTGNNNAYRIRVFSSNLDITPQGGVTFAGWNAGALGGAPTQGTLSGTNDTGTVTGAYASWSYNATLMVVRSVTNLNTPNIYGLGVDMQVNNSVSGLNNAGFITFISTPVGYAVNQTTMYAWLAQNINQASSGTITSQFGMAAASFNLGAGLVTTQVGASGTANNSSTGAITTQSGITAAASNTGAAAITTQSGLTVARTHSGAATVTTSQGVSIARPTGGASAVFTNSYGLRILDQTATAGTHTNPSIALLIESQSGSNAQGIRQEGSGLNLLNGDTTFGAKAILKTYTVATLPSGTTGAIVYATNLRVFNGAGTQEGAGVGTGGSVEYNGSAWKIAGTNITAVA